MGHILWYYGIKKELVEGKLEGRNHKGRPHLEYTKQVLMDMKCDS